MEDDFSVTETRHTLDWPLRQTFGAFYPDSAALGGKASTSVTTLMASDDDWDWVLTRNATTRAIIEQFVALAVRERSTDREWFAATFSVPGPTMLTLATRCTPDGANLQVALLELSYDSRAC